MASNKLWSWGPVALTNTLTTNILNFTITSLAGPVGTTLTQPYFIMRHIRIVNKTAGPVTFSLYLGLTGANTAGTEVIGTGLNAAANQAYDWYGMMRMDVAQFLVGGASAATSLTIQGEGEIGFV